MDLDPEPVGSLGISPQHRVVMGESAPVLKQTADREVRVEVWKVLANLSGGQELHPQAQLAVQLVLLP